MNTFEQVLTDDAWVEVLNGGDFIAFDLLASKSIECLMTETADIPDPTEKGNSVVSWSSDWDFSASGLTAGVQRVWLKGNNTVRGVR